MRRERRRARGAHQASPLRGPSVDLAAVARGVALVVKEEREPVALGLVVEVAVGPSGVRAGGVRTAARRAAGPQHPTLETLMRKSHGHPRRKRTGGGGIVQRHGHRNLAYPQAQPSCPAPSCVGTVPDLILARGHDGHNCLYLISQYYFLLMGDAHGAPAPSATSSPSASTARCRAPAEALHVTQPALSPTDRGARARAGRFAPRTSQPQASTPTEKGPSTCGAAPRRSWGSRDQNRRRLRARRGTSWRATSSSAPARARACASSPGTSPAFPQQLSQRAVSPAQRRGRPSSSSASSAVWTTSRSSWRTPTTTATSTCACPRSDAWGGG